MWGTIIPVHTGYVWLDVVVYAVSGGAFVYICYLLPQWYRSVVRPQLESLDLPSRRNDKQNQ